MWKTAVKCGFAVRILEGVFGKEAPVECLYQIYHWHGHVILLT